jgi:hypothetical protein
LSTGAGLLPLNSVAAVNLTFPTNWIWWVTIIVGTLVVSGAAEVLIYYLVDLRDIKLDH